MVLALKMEEGNHRQGALAASRSYLPPRMAVNVAQQKFLKAL